MNNVKKMFSLGLVLMLIIWSVVELKADEDDVKLWRQKKGEGYELKELYKLAGDTELTDEDKNELWKQVKSKRKLKAKTYCFEDYKWGQTLVDTKNQLKNKNKDFESINKEDSGHVGLAYSDKIFGESCYVVLSFTPKSKLLAGIVISWEDTSVGAGLKNLLTKKYGIPTQPNQFMENIIGAMV